MLHDDHSKNYWFLFAFPDTSAKKEAWAISDAAAAFHVPKSNMSDVQKRFKNETVWLAAKRLNVLHHFTLHHSPCRKGTIGRLGRELLRGIRSVTPEF